MSLSRVVSRPLSRAEVLDRYVEFVAARCEGCGYYQTTIEFKPTLRAQAEHAALNHQRERAAIYNHLLDGLEQQAG